MRITREQFRQAVDEGLAAVAAGNGARPRYENAIESALGTLGIEIEDPGACGDLFVWVERTWADVRQHDVVRPVGQPERESRVVSAGPVSTAARTGAVARRVVLAALAGEGRIDTQASPWLPVEIRVTEAELAAIELLGGWDNRVAISESGV